MFLAEQVVMRPVLVRLVLMSEGCIMTHVNALHQEDHVFRNVGGVIGNALQISGNEHQIDRGGDGAGLSLHVFDQLSVDQVP